MATPTFACGGECGIGPHFRTVSGTVTRDTGTKRSGLSSIKLTSAGASGVLSDTTGTGISGTVAVIRCYVNFSTLPSANFLIAGDTNGVGAVFKSSDSKIYAGNETTQGATGVSVTTGVWYRLDIKNNVAANPWLIDVQVDGAACGQASIATGASSVNAIQLGSSTTITTIFFVDDILASSTSGDYPLGAGYVISYIPNEDGDGASANRHNGLGSNEVERTLTGTDITNTTTTAFQLVDDRPMETAAGDFIAWLTNGTAGDYVEVAYENTAESAAPRSVEAIAGYHDAGGAGTNNFQVTLRESGGATTADIVPAATRNVGATMSWFRAHFATVPGTSDAWTLTKFNALRSRFIATDASPDVYLDGLMLEAEYASTASAAITGTITPTATEADIVTGGKTIIITLTGDTWVTAGATFDGERANIAAGIDSAQAEGTGWDAVVKAGIDVGDVVRTSDTVVTVTLDAEATYNITATETITVTVPDSAVTGTGPYVATPTFTVTAIATSSLKDVIGTGIVPFAR